MSRIYVASSWRNPYQPDVVEGLRRAGHQVYDFRNPAPGNHGFHWSEIDPHWESWRASQFRELLLRSPIAATGFGADWGAMSWADTGVLLLPCGRSAHLEAGYFVGAGKPLHILLAELPEPELMYRMATSISLTLDELLDRLGAAVAR